MKIRLLTEKDLDQYQKISYQAYPGLRDFSEEGQRNYRAQVGKSLGEKNEEDFYGAEENGRLLGVFRHIHFQMNLFGKFVPVAGFGYLAVDPLYKKQGIASKLLNFFEEKALEAGENLGLLLPFRPDFYHIHGYGYLGKMNLYRLDPLSLPKAEADYTYKEISPKEALDFRIQATDKVHGLTLPLEVEREAYVEDLATIYLGCYQEDRLIATAIYHWESLNASNYTKNALVLDDLLALDGQGYLGIFAYLRTQADQAQYIQFFSQEKNLAHYFENPTDTSDFYFANGYLQTNIQAIGLMAKVLDPVALYKTLYPQGPHLSLHLGEKEVKTGPNPSLSLRTSDQVLASLFCREISFQDLHFLGLAKCPEKDLDQLASLFPGGYTIHNNADF